MTEPAFPAAASVAYTRPIFEIIPDRLWCENDVNHEVCITLKGARWPDPIPADDLDQWTTDMMTP